MTIDVTHYMQLLLMLNAGFKTTNANLLRNKLLNECENNMKNGLCNSMALLFDTIWQKRVCHNEGSDTEAATLLSGQGAFEQSAPNDT